MRLLADENVYPTIVRALRAVAHDVESVREDSPGISDLEVLRPARLRRRALLTFDLGFGRLISQQGEPSPPGAILIRLPAHWTWAAMAERVVTVLASERDISRFFVVVGTERVRYSRLPGGELS